MVSVTQEAKVELREILDRQSSDEVTSAQMVVRLVLEEQSGDAPSRFTITFDEQREGDHVIEHEKRKVLLLDPGVAGATTDLTLDVVEADGRRRLTLRG